MCLWLSDSFENLGDFGGVSSSCSTWSFERCFPLKTPIESILFFPSIHFQSTSPLSPLPDSPKSFLFFPSNPSKSITFALPLTHQKPSCFFHPSTPIPHLFSNPHPSPSESNPYSSLPHLVLIPVSRNHTSPTLVSTCFFQSTCWLGRGVPR